MWHHHIFYVRQYIEKHVVLSLPKYSQKANRKANPNSCICVDACTDTSWHYIHSLSRIQFTLNFKAPKLKKVLDLKTKCPETYHYKLFQLKTVLPAVSQNLTACSENHFTLTLSKGKTRDTHIWSTYFSDWSSSQIVKIIYLQMII